MRTTSLTLLFGLPALAAACGGKPTPASNTTAAVGNSGAAAIGTAAPAVCPDPAVLQAAVSRYWQVSSPQPFTIECVPGRFGEPGYLLDVVVEPGEGDAMPRAGTVILAADLERALVAGTLDELPWGVLEGSDSAWSANDLDHDGVDELLTWYSSDRHGYMEGGLLVLRVGDGAMATVATIPLSSDNGAAIDPDDPAAEPRVSCDATWVVEPGADADVIRVTVTWIEGDPAGGACLPPGEHAFRLGPAGLAELPR